MLPCCHGPPALPMLVRPECRCQSIVNIAQCAGAHASSRCTRRASSRCTRRASVGQAVDARVGDAVDARVGQASGKQSMHASRTRRCRCWCAPGMLGGVSAALRTAAGGRQRLLSSLLCVLLIKQIGTKLKCSGIELSFVRAPRFCTILSEL